MTAAPEALGTFARIQEASFARASTATARAFPPERRMDAAMLGAFLARKRYGVLATVRGDGRPHAAPVGFAVAGDRFVIPSLDGAARVANVRTNPFASLVIGEDEGMAHGVVIAEGNARLLPPLEATLEMRAPFRDESGSLPDWIGFLVVISPERILSYAAEDFVA